MIQSRTQNFRDPVALALFFLTTIAGLSLDLWTKAYAFARLSHPHAIYAFIPGYIEFEITRNPGAVFGLGAGRTMLFVTVSIAAILFLTFLFANSGRQRIYQFILGMLLAGVLGNMYDRIRFAYVRDMIHALPRWPGLFPWIFNVADVLLCTGVGLMILYSIVHGKEPRTIQSGTDQAPVPR